MMKNVFVSMMSMLVPCSVWLRSSYSYELLLLQGNLSEMSEADVRSAWQKLQFSETHSLKASVALILSFAYSIKNGFYLYPSDKDNLLKCNTKQKLAAYFLQDVKVYDPVNKEIKYINFSPMRTKYKAGDLYEVDPLFGDALDSKSEKFKEFSVTAQGEIVAFKKAINTLWPLVQKLRKDAGLKD